MRYSSHSSNYGTGLRLVAASGAVYRADIAYGSEGSETGHDTDDPNTDPIEPDAAGPQSSVLNFNGGTLRATADNADFITNPGNSTLFQVNVQENGAQIDTNGYAVTITAALTEDPLSLGGGLTKLGAGTLTLTGANTYAGDTTVSEGTLSTTASTMLDDDADLLIALNAVMNLNFTGTDTIASLYINGEAKGLGIWGSTLSGAPNTDSHFTGDGWVEVTVLPSLIPGDTDGDGDVDGDDAEVLAANWGASVTPGDYASGDFNGDGIVNAADAAILAGNWTGPTEGDPCVPEPGALALLLGLGLAIVVRRTRR